MLGLLADVQFEMPASNVICYFLFCYICFSVSYWLRLVKIICHGAELTRGLCNTVEPLKLTTQSRWSWMQDGLIRDEIHMICKDHCTKLCVYFIQVFFFTINQCWKPYHLNQTGGIQCDFSAILCLWFAIQGILGPTTFLTEFQTLVVYVLQLMPFFYGKPSNLCLFSARHRPKSSLERGSTRCPSAVLAIEETDENLPEPEMMAMDDEGKITTEDAGKEQDSPKVEVGYRDDLDCYTVPAWWL